MKIEHSAGSYEVQFVGLDEAIQSLPHNRWFITDHNVVHYWGEALKDAPFIDLAPGEGSKCLQVFEECLETLASGGATRDTVVVAYGGGVIGDLAGFVASAYMRGVPFVQMPTTLLAQVDSAIGGKVGVDLRAGKNLAGAFYPPSRVYVCVELLGTLPEKQFRNGMAEVLKYGFIADPELAALLGTTGFNAGSRGLEELVRRCLEIKAEVVAADEFETAGRRAILNFGHTVGHALEQALGYEGLLHGEAVAVGMVAEAALGEALGLSRPGTCTAVRSAVEFHGLPALPPKGIAPPALLPAMHRDKKRRGAGLAFSLLTEVGECTLVNEIQENDVIRALDALWQS